MWPNEDQNFVERSNPNVLKQGVVKEIRSGFKSSKKRGFILSSKTLKIYKDEKVNPILALYCFPLIVTSTILYF